MLDALVHKRNDIVARQLQFQRDTRHVYAKTPRAGLYMTGFMVLFSVGTLGVLHGAYKMALGKK